MLDSREGWPFLAFGGVAIIFGGVAAAVESLNWYHDQALISLLSRASQISQVEQFFIIEGVDVTVLIIGGYAVLMGLRAWAPGVTSIRGIVSDALSSSADRKVGALCGVGYGAVYAFVSGTLVFQPTVNFAGVYGVSSAGWNVATCCGGAGSVPAVVVYLLPQAHLALQVLPLNILLQFVFPLLVGFNLAMVSYSLRRRQARVNGGWVSAVALASGLFTGCPTCAGYFLAGTLGGAGATAVALALTPFQALLVAVSVPVLVLSPVLVALGVKRSQKAACAVPQVGR